MDPPLTWYTLIASRKSVLSTFIFSKPCLKQSATCSIDTRRSSGGPHEAKAARVLESRVRNGLIGGGLLGDLLGLWVSVGMATLGMLFGSKDGVEWGSKSTMGVD